MPKMKTHKTAKRRLRVTGSGKIMHSKVGKSHLRLKKAPRVKRQYSRDVVLDHSNESRIRRLLPYG
jgi:large subunit ribosomal protein L35